MSEEKKNEVEVAAPVAKKVVQRKSTKEKLQLLAKFQKLCKAGKTAMEAAKEIGVPYITLHYWTKHVVPVLARGSKATKTPVVEPVQEQPKKVAKKHKAVLKAAFKKPTKVAQSKLRKLFQSVVTITFPNGMRVECASAKSAAEVLTAL